MSDKGQNLTITFASRTLNKAEKYYSVIEKELLRIVWGIKHFRHYLYGKKFEIQTDHKPLVWLFSIKGKNNVVSDALSRAIDPQLLVFTRSKKTSLPMIVPEELNTDIESKVTLKDTEIKQILYQYHDSPFGGHTGIFKTIRRKYIGG